ncbi:hypothetical protein M9Y10_036526 [Tritrichomonas musculus]|uniref:HAT C-terminal dimerisation domain-containing protein n=1 Tax=Tritrichomonas musculus TaxID=1915356 RepID=A0ABR2GV38_9EUKA
MQSDISEDCTSEVDYDELMNFIDSKAKKSKKNFFDYWSSPKAKVRYPNLTEFARSLFIHSFTSLYIERCFSRCKRILKYDRLAMTKEHASMIAVLKINSEILVEICHRESINSHNIK